jgi:hypothetical protein
VRTISWFVLLGLVALMAPRHAGAEEAEVLAAWKRHELQFTYMGFTTRYSCEGLRDKMRLLLEAAGAHDLKVTPRGCNSMAWQVTEFPRVRMVFYAPELPAAGQREVGPPVAARWTPVTLTRRQPRALELGDCELVEQFRDRVLPAFTTRAVRQDINCIPHQLSGSSFSLTFDVLVGHPSPDEARPSGGATGGR